MGDNFSYGILEEQVINLYNAGLLNLTVLDILCEPYRGTDIDSGGSADLQTNDGKFFEELAVELIEPDFKPDLSNPDDPYNEFSRFSDIKYERWGWR